MYVYQPKKQNEITSDGQPSQIINNIAPLKNKIMKKVLYLLLLGTCLKLQAQNIPVIDSTVVVQQGQSVQIQQLYNALSIPTGTAGAQQLFDYSILPNFNATITVTGIDNSNSPYAANFPQSNATVSWTGGGNPYYHFSVDVNKYIYYGGGSTYSNFTYSDVYEQLHFPFTYLDTYSDSFTAVSNTGGHRNGHVTVTADAYGTLLLPNTSVNDVLRIKRESVYWDTVNNIPRQNIETYYEFYKSNNPHYILLHGFYTIISQGSAPVDGAMLFLNNNTVTNQKNSNTNISILQAFLSDNNVLQCQIKEAGNYTVNVHNALGQILHSQKYFFESGHNSIRLNLPEFHGILFIDIQGKNNQLKLKATSH